MTHVATSLVLLLAAGSLNAATGEASAAPASATDGAATARPADRVTDDLDAALARAREIDKPLVCVCLARGWGQPAARFETDVLPSLAKPGKWVLLCVEFPASAHGLPSAKIDDLRRLYRRLAPEQMPQVMVLAPDGSEIARTRFREGPAQSLLAELDLRIEQHALYLELLGEAANLKGEARLAKLDAAFRCTTPDRLLNRHANELAELAAMDADGTKGWRTAYGDLLYGATLLSDLKEAQAAGDSTAFSTAIFRFASATHKRGTELQRIQLIVLKSVIRAGDLAAARQLAEAIAKEIPGSPEARTARDLFGIATQEAAERTPGN